MGQCFRLYNLGDMVSWNLNLRVVGWIGTAETLTGTLAWDQVVKRDLPGKGYFFFIFSHYSLISCCPLILFYHISPLMVQMRC